MEGCCERRYICLRDDGGVKSSRAGSHVGCHQTAISIANELERSQQWNFSNLTRGRRTRLDTSRMQAPETKEGWIEGRCLKPVSNADPCLSFTFTCRVFGRSSVRSYLCLFRGELLTTNCLLTIMLDLARRHFLYRIELWTFGSLNR